MGSKSVDVNGITSRWEERGAGQPVIFLHGIPTSPGLWRHVIPRMHHVHALAWELVGYGATMREGRNHAISVGKQAD